MVRLLVLVATAIALQAQILLPNGTFRGVREYLELTNEQLTRIAAANTSLARFRAQKATRSAQVHADWVPWRPAINMAVLDDDTAAEVYRRCGYFFTLHPAVVAEDAVILPIALGNRCGSIERRYRLQRTATGWQAELLPAAEGWAVAHCGCS